MDELCLDVLFLQQLGKGLFQPAKNVLGPGPLPESCRAYAFRQLPKGIANLYSECRANQKHPSKHRQTGQQDIALEQATLLIIGWIPASTSRTAIGYNPIVPLSP